jgi:hypothetical protein
VLAGQTEATISVRGKDRFVVMDVAQYHHLRECKREAALAKSRSDIAAERSVTETTAEHMQHMERLLAEDSGR